MNIWGGVDNAEGYKKHGGVNYTLMQYNTTKYHKYDKMALNKQKTDPELGLLIQRRLESVGVNTPSINNDKFGKKQLEIIEENFKNIMIALGLDIYDDSLNKTPHRVANMLLFETFWGLDTRNFPKCTTVDNKMNYDEMVVECGISVQSVCEHHFVAIDGLATVGYMPKGKVLGLSKMNRIVEYFSRRPQIQERLTSQIWHALNYVLETDDIAVTIDAKHHCVKSRGVEDAGSKTVSSKIGGVFKNNPHTRAEFFSLLRKS